MTASLSLTEVSAFKTELESLLEQLQEEVAEDISNKYNSDEAGVSVHDVGDDAEASVELMMNMGTLAHHSEELAECIAALKRIESGDFGFCIDCAEEIELSRLKACPTASRCIRCQSAHESELKQSA